MPCLVYDLRRGVILRIERGDLLDNATAADERALLGMEELGYLPRLQMRPQLRSLGLAQAVPNLGAPDPDHLIGEAHRIFPRRVRETSRCGSPRPIDPVCPWHRERADPLASRHSPR